MCSPGRGIRKEGRGELSGDAHGWVPAGVLPEQPARLGPSDEAIGGWSGVPGQGAELGRGQELFSGEGFRGSGLETLALGIAYWGRSDHPGASGRWVCQGFTLVSTSLACVDTGHPPHQAGPEPPPGPQAWKTAPSLPGQAPLWLPGPRSMLECQRPPTGPSAPSCFAQAGPEPAKEPQRLHTALTHTSQGPACSHSPQGVRAVGVAVPQVCVPQVFVFPRCLCAPGMCVPQV